MKTKSNWFFFLLFIGLFACVENHQIKKEQYINAGRNLYINNCGNCHGLTGEGLAKLVPPLNDSAYLLQNMESVPCIITLGISGPMQVNGVEYNQPMAGHPELRNLEIAEIITFLMNDFNQVDTLITDQQVRKFLAECNSETIPGK